MAPVASLRRAVRWAVVETPWLAMWLVAWPVLALGRRAIITQPRPLPFMPDLAQLELVVVSALRLELLVGPPSRNGFWHLGPVPYYWQAPFYAATGRSPVGMQLAAAVASALCLALIVLAVDRMAGVRGRWVAVAVLVAWIARFGLPGLASAWNPSLTSLPLALCLVSLAAVLGGHRRWLPVAAAAGTYAAQAHLGSLPVVVAAAVAVVVVEVRRARRSPMRPWRRALLATGVVLGVLWAPVAVDQLVGERNATRIAGYLLLDREYGTPYSFSVDPHERTVTPVAAVEQVALLATQVQTGSSGWGSFDHIVAATIEPDRTSVLVLVLLLAGAGVLGALCVRLDRRGHAALCGLAALAIAVTVVSTWQIPGEVFLYYTAHAGGIGLVLWLAVALAAVEVAAGLRPAVRDQAARATAATIAAVSMVLVVPHVDELRSSRPPAAFFAEADDLHVRVGEALREAWGPLPRSADVDGRYPSAGVAVVALEVQLLRMDVDVTVPERWAMYGTTAQQQGPPGEVALWVTERGDQPPEGYELLVSVPRMEQGAAPFEVFVDRSGR